MEKSSTNPCITLEGGGKIKQDIGITVLKPLIRVMPGGWFLLINIFNKNFIFVKINIMLKKLF